MNKLIDPLLRIPNRIFYVWFGAGISDEADQCIRSWNKVMPGTEVVRIGDAASHWFDLERELKQCAWLRAVHDRKLWAFVSDYVRLKVLHDHGGLYLDTDVMLRRSLEPMRRHGFFAGLESSEFVNGAVLGSVPGHRLLREIINFYQSGIRFEPAYVIPEIISAHLSSMYGFFPYDSRRIPQVTHLDEGVAIYPESAFYPFRHTETFAPPCVGSRTCAIHWWKGSWLGGEAAGWLSRKHLGNGETLFPANGSLWRKKMLVAGPGFVPCLGAEKQGDIHRFSLGTWRLPLRLLRSPSETALLWNERPLFKRGRKQGSARLPAAPGWLRAELREFLRLKQALQTGCEPDGFAGLCRKFAAYLDSASSKPLRDELVSGANWLCSADQVDALLEGCARRSRGMIFDRLCRPGKSEVRAGILPLWGREQSLTPPFPSAALPLGFPKPSAWAAAGNGVEEVLGRYPRIKSTLAGGDPVLLGAESWLWLYSAWGYGALLLGRRNPQSPAWPWLEQAAADPELRRELLHLSLRGRRASFPVFRIWQHEDDLLAQCAETLRRCLPFSWPKVVGPEASATQPGPWGHDRPLASDSTVTTRYSLFGRPVLTTITLY